MTALMTFYILVWPVVVAIVLIIIASAFLKEMRKARLNNRPMI